MALDVLAQAVGLVIALFVHELGHLFAARCCSVRVPKISIGIGPELLALHDRNGTHWSFRALPLAGSCRFDDGEAPQILARRRLFSDVSATERAAVFAAGPLFSFAFPAAIAVALYLANGWPASFSESVTRPDIFVGVTISLFSLMVGVFNLLPFMPLDGGQLILVAVERWRGASPNSGVRALYMRLSAWTLRILSAAIAAAIVWLILQPRS